MLNFIDLGRKDYQSTRDLQLRLFRQMISLKREGKTVDKETVLLVEHEPVFTMGRHADHNNMLVSNRYLDKLGVDCVEIERGGDITFHGPGQLVVYPIIDMSRHHLGVKAYVNLLEEAVIRTLDKFDIRGQRVDGATGVWIEAGSERERKICAIGSRCSHYVTMHGFALNISTDLSWFSMINPCGFKDKGVTSMSGELKRDVPVTEVKKIICDELSRLLQL